jgi:hypothetical protein
MSQKLKFTHVLTSGQIATGTVYNLAHLSAKYQIWMRKHGLSDAESLACWIHGNEAKQLTYFSSVGEAEQLAKSGFAKYTGALPSDLGQDVPDGGISFATFEFTPK